MDIRNCKSCGKMFNYSVGEPICPACRAALEEKFQEVKKFVQDNRTATLNEICDTCDVDVKQVKKWVRDERLVFANDSPVKINCEGCGTQIATGRFCDKCRKSAYNSFDSLVKSGSAKNRDNNNAGGVRMHTFKDL